MHRVALLALLLFAPILHAATPAYTSEDVLIPMRDGLRLHAVVLRPAHAAPHADEGLPILLDRTPYGASSLTAADFVKR
jgi:predicted acyl esterase